VASQNLFIISAVIEKGIFEKTLYKGYIEVADEKHYLSEPYISSDLAIPVKKSRELKSRLSYPKNKYKFRNKVICPKELNFKSRRLINNKNLFILK
jgi:hypothetical protein